MDIRLIKIRKKIRIFFVTGLGDLCALEWAWQKAVLAYD